MRPSVDAFPVDHPLDESALVAAVLVRNPSLAAMQATWREAQARYPQESALPEPMLSYGLAPESLRESLPGQEITLSQPLPWPQRLARHGDVALAGADAAGADVITLRLQLIADSKHAFADYWLADRQLLVNAALRVVVAQMHASQKAAYGAGQGSRAMSLQTEEMLNELDHHAILFRHARTLAIARLNFLLHEPSDHPLPPPPEQLPEPTAIADAHLLTLLALSRRSDLAAAAARVRRANAQIRLVAAENLPDVSVSVGYNTMWNDPNMRLMVGVDVSLPLNRDARGAARNEAQAATERASAQLQALTDRVQYEVQESREHLLESYHILHLLQERTIPTEEALVAAAQDGVTSGGTGYVAVLDARRQLIETKWECQQALADFHQHLADLERVVGGTLPAVQALKDNP